MELKQVEQKVTEFGERIKTIGEVEKKLIGLSETINLSASQLSNASKERIEVIKLHESVRDELMNLASIIQTRNKESTESILSIYEHINEKIKLIETLNERDEQNEKNAIGYYNEIVSLIKQFDAESNKKIDAVLVEQSSLKEALSKSISLISISIDKLEKGITEQNSKIDNSINDLELLLKSRLGNIETTLQSLDDRTKVNSTVAQETIHDFRKFSYIAFGVTFIMLFILLFI